jgi:hypothetical protein
MGNKKRIPSRPAPAFIRVRTAPLTCPVCGRSELNVQHVCSRCWMQIPAADRQQLYHMTHRGMNTESKVEQVVAKLKESRPQLGSILGTDGKTPADALSALQSIARTIP